MIRNSAVPQRALRGGVVRSSPDTGRNRCHGRHCGTGAAARQPEGRAPRIDAAPGCCWPPLPTAGEGVGGWSRGSRDRQVRPGGPPAAAARAPSPRSAGAPAGHASSSARSASRTYPTTWPDRHPRPRPRATHPAPHQPDARTRPAYRPYHPAQGHQPVDVPLLLMASALYRILARRFGNGPRTADARTLFREAVHASASIEITPDEIVVALGRRTRHPLRLQAGDPEIRQTLPWLDNRTLPLRRFRTHACMFFPGAGNPDWYNAAGRKVIHFGNRPGPAAPVRSVSGGHADHGRGSRRALAGGGGAWRRVARRHAPGGMYGDDCRAERSPTGRMVSCRSPRVWRVWTVRASPEYGKGAGSSQSTTSHCMRSLQPAGWVILVRHG